MTPSTRAQIQELVRRLAGGDRAAITPAFAALWPVVRSFTRRALAHDDDAEDAAQRAITKLFAQAASFDPARDALAWALSIAHYECRTVRKTLARRREDALEPGAGAPALVVGMADTPEALAVDHDLAAAALAVLEGLGRQDVLVIMQALEQDRPTKDATYRKRLQRALARLRLAWKAKHGSL